jgi:hypothetical protein
MTKPWLSGTNFFPASVFGIDRQRSGIGLGAVEMMKSVRGEYETCQRKLLSWAILPITAAR